MDDEEGKGAAASESTGVDVNVDVPDVQAKASTSMHDARRTTTTTAAVAAESSTLTSASTTSSANTAAAGEADQDSDDAGIKMNHNQPNPSHHGPGYYGGGGPSRHPLPMSLPARSSTNSFTPINNYSHQEDHHNTALTLPPIGSINSLPPPQPQASRQRTSLPTARPGSSATSNVSYYPGHTDGRLLPSNFGISPGEMAQYALLPPESKAFQRQAPKKVWTRMKRRC